jgi:two-component system cell cycle response regulator
MTDDDKTTFITQSNKPFIKESAWTACLVVLKGEDIGNKVLLNKDEITIGRAKNADMCLTRGDVSRMHAIIQRVDEQQFMLVDNDSTNGTLVNAQSIKSILLKDRDIISIGDSQLKFLSSDSSEQAYYDGLYKRISLDKVLRIHNKYYFLSKLDEEMIRSQRHGSHLSLVLLDVDDFKQINESYGHQAGDAALIQLAEICKNCIKETDILCRYGVEKFAIIMPETNQQQACTLSESIQKLVTTIPVNYANIAIDITVSIGVTGYASSSATESFTKGILISQAEKAMYEAKRKTGSNKIVFVDSTP